MWSEMIPESYSDFFQIEKKLYHSTFILVDKRYQLKYRLLKV